jgi:hypothetical protein
MLSGSVKISQSLKPGASQPAVAPVGLQAPAHKARGQSPTPVPAQVFSQVPVADRESAVHPDSLATIA